MVTFYPFLDGRALCAETDPDAFVPERGGPNAAASAICARCELKDPCLSWALRNDTDGIYAGTTPTQRERMRQGLGIVPLRFEIREPINHGTIGGYRAHSRHGVPMCEECRAAEARRNALGRRRGAA